MRMAFIWEMILRGCRACCKVTVRVRVRVRVGLGLGLGLG